MKFKQMLMVAILAVSMTSCAAAIPIVTTVLPAVLQIATIICKVAAEKHPWNWGGLTADEWCETPNLVLPMFGDEAQAAIESGEYRALQAAESEKQK